LRVFLDTNVLVSAFATRGLGADVLRFVLSSHELVLGEVILEELLGFLREHEIVERPERIEIEVDSDPSDEWVLASAMAAGVECLVTGDRNLLEESPTLLSQRQGEAEQEQPTEDKDHRAVETSFNCPVHGRLLTLAW